MAYNSVGRIKRLRKAHKNKRSSRKFDAIIGRDEGPYGAGYRTIYVRPKDLKNADEFAKGEIPLIHDDLYGAKKENQTSIGVSVKNLIRVSKLINPVFHDVWKSSATNKILYGGRSSMKSSCVSLRLVFDFLCDPNMNVVVFRKVASSIALSVYEQIKWAINMFGAESQFKFYTAPAKIKHLATGTAFYFSGADDTQKIKGMNIATGYIGNIWLEEANDFKPEEITQIKATVLREKLPNDKKIGVWYSYNPPRDKYNAFNLWVESVKKEDEYLVHHSSYLDDQYGFLSQQILDEIELYKKNDYDYYRWLFLGEVIGLSGNIFNADLINVVKNFKDNERLQWIYYSVDSGYQTSATVFVCAGVTNLGNLYVLDTYYYSPEKERVKKAPSDFSEELHEFIRKTAYTWQVPIKSRWIDSAEGALRNQYFKDYNQRLQPVAKAKKVNMIERMHSLLARGSFFILDKPCNEIVLEELKKYCWDEETLKTDNPQPIKRFDHSVDAIQYIVFNNARDLGLKW